MRKLLRFVAIAGPLVAALGVAVYAVAVTPQKALIYCPVAIDSIGCHNVVGALSGPNGPFPNGVDRGYDGTAGTVDLATADLSSYAVFIIPSLADDSVSKPYELLRNSRIAYRLSLALEGRLVVWSGTPDQGTQSRDLKDKLIRNLAVWARGADSAAATGLVVLGDHSEVASQRYAWLAGFAGLAVSPDTVAQVYDSVKTLTATGIAILDNGGTQLAYPAMASFGVQPPAAASGAAVDARGSSAEGQVVLVTSPRRLASVQTDKPDYSPGETVTFTGSGWEPGEVVTLLPHEATTLHDDRALTATADPLGNIVNNEFKPEPHDVGVTFYVTASGQASGLAAQTRFTDGTVKVMSAPAGVTFTLTWTRFATTACTGTIVDFGTATVGSSGGAVFSKNVGNTESIKLEASATSNQGGAFASWSGPAGTFTTDPLNPRIICVSGTFTGNREYTATYSTKPPPTVTTEIHNASHAVVTSVPAGTTVHDKATVSGAFGTPTGTVTFTFFTTSSACTGASVGSGTVTLDASGVAHPSASQGPLTAGSYSFKAAYSGDANYTTGDSPCEPLTVTALTPTVATEIHDASHAAVTSVPAGTTVHDKATVSGAFGTPTGTVTFTFFTTSSACTGASVGSGTVTLDASGVAHPSTSQGPLSAGSYSFIAHYSGDLNYTATDSPCEPLTVTGSADLSITKTDNPDPVNAGATLTYTVTVSNGGPSTAANVQVTDNLPAGVTFQNASGTGWTCVQGGGVVTCTRGSVAPGGAPPITITVTPAICGTITNRATVGSTTIDPSAANNTATASTMVQRLPGKVTGR